MNNVHEEAQPLPLHSSPRMRTLIPFTVVSTFIAIIWALSDSGQIDGYWGKLACIFFTWLTAMMTTWALALSRKKE